MQSLNKRRENLRQESKGGPIVDEFFSTVPGWFFDMCSILLEPKAINPSEFTLSRVKCQKSQLISPQTYSQALPP